MCCYAFRLVLILSITQVVPNAIKIPTMTDAPHAGAAAMPWPVAKMVATAAKTAGTVPSKPPAKKVRWMNSRPAVRKNSTMTTQTLTSSGRMSASQPPAFKYKKAQP